MISTQIWSTVLSIVFVVFYFCVVFGVLLIFQRRRKTRWPFKEGDRLLRSPGESLKRKIHALDERFIFEVLGMLMAATIIVPLIAWIMKQAGVGGLPVLAGIVIGMILVAAVSAWRVVKLFRNRSKYYLGWFGERLVAEMLQPLQLQGYRIFHDVPGESGKKGFNIDHVVVGPTGVTAVEVKTRRKGNARSGYKDHEVSFDGTQLNWPWGYDRHGIEQTVSEADWLHKWIAKTTDLNVPVKPALALPGWYVRETPSPRLRVVNPSFLPDAICGRGEITLTPQQIDLISRQLDQRCRDVEE